MIEFPLNPEEESPQLVTKHNKTASVSASLYVETVWKGKGLGASLVYACPALPWPLVPGP